MNPLLSFFGLGSPAVPTVPAPVVPPVAAAPGAPPVAAAPPVAFSAEDVREAMTAAAAEIEKLKTDKAWAENRLREEAHILAGQVTALQTSLAGSQAEVARLTGEVSTVTASTNAKAVAQLALLGHNVIPIGGPAATGATSAEAKIMDDYKALSPGPDREAYRQKHKKHFPEIPEK